MSGWNGGVIGATRTPTILAASGVWAMNLLANAQRAGIWPRQRDVVAFDAVTTGGSSFSHTVGSGNNRKLLVCTWADSSGVTYNGVAMTKVAQVQQGSGMCSIWELTAPPVGTYTVATAGGGGYTIAASYRGVLQSPISLFATNSNVASATAPVTFTTTVDGCWAVQYTVVNGSVTSWSAGATQIATYGGVTAAADTDSPKTPAGSLTITANLSGVTNWGAVMVALEPAFL
ncbi:MAG: hypothetical protein Q8T13_04855 [Acidobacteriota bacterium]|nr:hypothetical protein [Acidobacteriota bacterium]